MNKLEELINELCPDGVEYKPIWELTIWDKKFNTVSKEKQNKVNKHFYYLAADLRALEVENGNIKILTTSATDLWTTEELAGDNMSDGEIVCIPWGGNPIVQYYKGKYITADNRIATSADTSVLNNKFLYYFLQTKMNLISSFYRGSGIKHPDMSKVLDLQIPLPPLSVQSEIVHILDSFTLLTAELTAELTARQKQYAFYRDYLLDFSDEDIIKKIPDIDCSNVEYKRLGEVCNVQSGGTPSKKESEYWNGGTIPWLASTVCKNKKSVEEVTNYITEKGLKNSSAKMMKEKTTLIALVGATIGKIAFLTFEASINQNVAGLFPIDENIINADYLFYACSTLYSKFQNLGNGKLAMANMSFVRNLVIPVPPLSVQENIVKILDRFDKLNNDMSEGLPAEIEARKKQYEYYRDTLLSFDDKACSQIVKVERELTRIKAIKWLKLGEIGKVRMCKRILKSQTNTQFGVPFYKIGTFGKKADAYVSNELFNEYKSKYSYPKKGDILISCSGTIGRTVVFNGEPAYFQDSNIVWLENDESVVLNTYLKYCYDRQPWRAESGGTIARLYNANIENAVIPVPSLEEQERIVSILDRFDKLCNDISEGLPAEIEARQKQYEYYRDKLLMFKRVETNEK